MKLNFRVSGQGAPLYILHGLFGLSDNWATIGKRLAEHFKVYLIDLRNHGSSPHSEEWTYPAMAQDVLELMHVEGHEKIILMGHSLGGKTAMHFASAYPEKLVHLVVADMAPKDYPGKQFDFIGKLLSVDLPAIKTRKEAETALRGILNDEATIQLLLKNIQWNEKEHLAWKFNLKTLAAGQDTIGKTFSIGSGIPTPALFIRGGNSNYVLDTDIPDIQRYFPQVKIETISGAGHWLHAEKPEEYYRILMKHL